MYGKYHQISISFQNSKVAPWKTWSVIVSKDPLPPTGMALSENLERPSLNWDNRHEVSQLSVQRRSLVESHCRNEGGTNCMEVVSNSENKSTFVLLQKGQIAYLKDQMIWCWKGGEFNPVRATEFMLRSDMLGDAQFSVPLITSLQDWRSCMPWTLACINKVHRWFDDLRIGFQCGQVAGRVSVVPLQLAARIFSWLKTSWHWRSANYHTTLPLWKARLRTWTLKIHCQIHHTHFKTFFLGSARVPCCCRHFNRKANNAIMLFPWNSKSRRSNLFQLQQCIDLVHQTTLQPRLGCIMCEPICFCFSPKEVVRIEISPAWTPDCIVPQSSQCQPTEKIGK